MALPIYQSKQIAPVVGGREATREISSSLQNLGQRIGQFKNMALQDLQQEAQETATKEADVIFLSDGIHGELREDDTIYAKTFNDRMINLTKNQTQIDINTKADEFALQFKNDPIGFDGAMGAYNKHTIQEAPESAKAELGLYASSVKSGKLAGLNIKAQNAIEAKERSVNKEKNIIANRNIEHSSYNGNVAMALTHLTDYKKDLQAQVTTGLMTDAQMNVLIHDAELNSTYATLDGVNDKLIEAGSFISAQKAIDDFKNTTHKSLDNNQRDTITAKLQAQVNKALSIKNANDKAKSTASTREINETIKNLENGNLVPNFDAVYAGTTGDKRVEMTRAFAVYKAVTPLKTATLAQLNTNIVALEKKKRKSEAEQMVLSYLKKKHSADKRDLEKSPIDVGVRNGLIEQHRSIDFSDVTKNGGMLKVREPGLKLLDAHYGIVSGAYSKDEVDSLNTAWPSMSIVEKSSLVKSISSLGTDRSWATFKQISKDNPELAMAGALMMQERGNIAEMVLKGIKIENSKDYARPPGLKGKFFEADGTYLNSLSANSKSMYTSAISAVYANLVSNDEGKLGEVGTNINILDEDLYEKAVKLVTGGVVDIGNGKKTIIPHHTWNENDFISRIDTLTLLYISEMGGFGGSSTGEQKTIDDNDTLEAIKNGDYELKFIGNGKYLIKNGSNILGNENGSNFILNFGG